MHDLFWLGGDIVKEVRGRLPFYKSDWRDAWPYGHRILVPSVYIFFASVLPALAFGEQLARETDKQLTVVHVLAATAIAGVTQAVVGGQPLLIIGVAEPIVILYSYMYQFAADQETLGTELFLPWVAWVCVWTSIMCAVVAVTGICRGISKFTRMAGELFGMLIAVLFMQQAIKGLISEFREDSLSDSYGSSPASPWLLVNGLWATILAIGLLASCMTVIHARSWTLGTGAMRGLLADYGVPAFVVAWSGLSFALTSQGNAVGVPSGVPRRIITPHTWEVKGSWLVARRMNQVPGAFIGAALIPALAITVLFWFDHGVSAQMAQPKALNLKKPPAYAYDMLLLAFLTLIMGLLGLPPVNGVLPQAPMHTHSLAELWERQNTRSISTIAHRKSALHHDNVSSNVSGPDVGPAAGEDSDSGAELRRAVVQLTVMPEEPLLVGAPGHVVRHLSFGPGTRTGEHLIRVVSGLRQRRSGDANSWEAAGPVGRCTTANTGGVPPPNGHALQMQRAGSGPWQQGASLGLSRASSLPSPNAAGSRRASLHEFGLPSNEANSTPWVAMSPPSAAAGAAAESQHHSRGPVVPPTHFFKTYQDSPVTTRHTTPRASSETQADMGPGIFLQTYQSHDTHHSNRSGAGQVPRALTVTCTSAAAAAEPVAHPHMSYDNCGDRTGREHVPKVPPCCADGVQNQHVTDNARQSLHVQQGDHVGDMTVMDVGVAEQRLSNLIQSLLVGACLGLTYAVKQVPTSVIWGFFAFMALDSLPGSQFAARLVLMITDPQKRFPAPYVDGVPFWVVSAFTTFQFVWLAGVWALTTWAGIAGVAFPVAIVLLVPIRQFVLPKVFNPAHLHQLDPDDAS